MLQGKLPYVRYCRTSKLTIGFDSLKVPDFAKRLQDYGIHPP